MCLRVYTRVCVSVCQCMCVCVYGFGVYMLDHSNSAGATPDNSAPSAGVCCVPRPRDTGGTGAGWLCIRRAASGAASGSSPARLAAINNNLELNLTAHVVDVVIDTRRHRRCRRCVVDVSFLVGKILKN